MEFVRIVKTQGAGFVPYMWPKAGSDIPVEKRRPRESVVRRDKALQSPGKKKQRRGCPRPVIGSGGSPGAGQIGSSTP